MFDRFPMNVAADNIDATSCERIRQQIFGTLPTSRTFGFFIVRRTETFSRAVQFSGISEKITVQVEAANDMACVT
jgi:hypothetical protein